MPELFGGPRAGVFSRTARTGSARGDFPGCPLGDARGGFGHAKPPLLGRPQAGRNAAAERTAMRSERLASERTPRHWVPACAGMTPSGGGVASPTMDSRFRGNDANSWRLVRRMEPRLPARRAAGTSAAYWPGLPTPASGLRDGASSPYHASARRQPSIDADRQQVAARRHHHIHRDVAARDAAQGGEPGAGISRFRRAAGLARGFDAAHGKGATSTRR